MAGWLGRKLVPCMWYLRVSYRESFSDVALVAITSTKRVPQLSESLTFLVLGLLGTPWTLLRLWVSLYPGFQCGRHELALVPDVPADGL